MLRLSFESLRELLVLCFTDPLIFETPYDPDSSELIEDSESVCVDSMMYVC